MPMSCEQAPNARHWLNPDLLCNGNNGKMERPEGPLTERPSFGYSWTGHQNNSDNDDNARGYEYSNSFT